MQYLVKNPRRSRKGFCIVYDYANVDMGDGDAGTAFSTQDRAKLRSREEAGQDRDTESMDLAVITAVMCEDTETQKQRQKRSRITANPVIANTTLHSRLSSEDGKGRFQALLISACLDGDYERIRYGRMFTSHVFRTLLLNPTLASLVLEKLVDAHMSRLFKTSPFHSLALKTHVHFTSRSRLQRPSRATGNLMIAFFSALAGTALVSGHHLGLVQHDIRQLAPEPASYCFTYFSCYLAAVNTPQLPYPLPGGVVTTITSIVSVPTLVPTFITPLPTTSLSSSLTSTSITTPGPSPLPGPADIILAIIPGIVGRALEKRTPVKRDAGGFISDTGDPNPQDCKAATVYRLDSGTLRESASLTFSIFADVGTGFAEFRSRDSTNAGANIIATTFSNDNSILRWLNPAFSGGEAGFCQVAATGQVYATFVASPVGLPAGCSPIRISVLDRKLNSVRLGISS
ncbi:hypothetical protein J7T55_006169 [Diaporthe amygdali]|uniref:uncharacterized protein n=1 Tax=Phomopsis amygdali TaxID=1214568 RepID=UPI0022FEAE63|nr:uncharacterized protein J7T55_006169 [Diaporthe amygdali]KAJ0124826.1 hypothetical protein J7T55_006169 [Diaporthe amygdali]